MPLNKLMSMGHSYALSFEQQTIHYARRDAWEASIKAKTPHMPMGDLFHCHLTLIARNDESASQRRCWVQVYGEVVFYESHALKERFVRKPAMNGMRKTYTQLLSLLQRDLDQDMNAYAMPDEASQVLVRPVSLLFCCHLHATSCRRLASHTCDPQQRAVLTSPPLL
jgi:hypothetical protein